MQTNTTTVSYNIQELIPYINWIYFFHAWGFQAKFASIAEYQCTDYTNWLDCFPEEDQWKASETISYEYFIVATLTSNLVVSLGGTVCPFSGII